MPRFAKMSRVFLLRFLRFVLFAIRLFAKNVLREKKLQKSPSKIPPERRICGAFLEKRQKKKTFLSKVGVDKNCGTFLLCQLSTSLAYNIPMQFQSLITENLPRLGSDCRVRTNHTRGVYPGYYPTKNFCEFCRTFIPVPGTSVSSVRPCHNTRNFWKFCKTFIPVPELLLVL